MKSASIKLTRSSTLKEATTLLILLTFPNLISKILTKHQKFSIMGDMRPAMENMADPILLEKVDKLFATGVGEYIPLPIIVVVGDQSSGKSSVLEGLTGLPFPRDSGLCTRFATQITFRRAAIKSISVSIIPGPGSSEEHQEEVRSWSKTDLKELAPRKFADIMKEV